MRLVHKPERELESSLEGFELEQQLTAIDVDIQRQIEERNCTETNIEIDEFSAEQATLFSIAQSLSQVNSESTVGLESYIGKSVSLEDASETLKNFLDGILKRIVSLWYKFLELIDNARTQAEQKLARMEYLKDRVDQAHSKNNNLVVQFGVQSQRLIIEGKVPPVKTLSKKVSALADILDSELIDELDMIDRIASKIIPTCKELILIEDASEENLAKAVSLAQKVAENGLLIRERRFKASYLKQRLNKYGDYVLNSEALPGNARLSFDIEPLDMADVRAKGLPLLRAMDNIFSMRAELDVETNTLKTDGEFPTLYQKEMSEFLRVSEKICKTIIRHKVRTEGTLLMKRKEFNAIRDEMRRVSRSGENVDMKLYVRRAANAMHGVSRWLYSPSSVLIGHSLRVVNALLAYVEQSQRQYKFD